MTDDEEQLKLFNEACAGDVAYTPADRAEVVRTLKEWPMAASILFMEGYSLKDFTRVQDVYGDNGMALVFTKVDGTKVAVEWHDSYEWRLIPVEDAGVKY